MGSFLLTEAFGSAIMGACPVGQFQAVFEIDFTVVRKLTENQSNPNKI